MILVGYQGQNLDGTFFFGNAVAKDMPRTQYELSDLTSEIELEVHFQKPNLKEIVILSISKLE